MNVHQVKDSIKHTECIDLIFSGQFCSEPIMTKNSFGELIDNYIVFTRNEDCSLISCPHCAFGIYSEQGQVAYVNNNISNMFSKDLFEERFESDDYMRQSYRKYIELFPQIREMYRSNKNLDKQLIFLYLDVLKVISGNTLFSFYQQLFPDFFDWASKPDISS